MPAPASFADALVDVTASLTDDFDLHDLLHRLTCHASSMSGAGLVGLVLADRERRARLLAVTDDTGGTRRLFALQEDQGPCVDVIDMEEAVVNVDIGAVVEIWPQFGPAALEEGFRSAHGLPLRLGRRVVGAVVLLDRSVVPLCPTTMAGVQALADLATVALVQDRAPALPGAFLDHLDAALKDRITVEQARGLLAQQRTVTVDEALLLLEQDAAAAGIRVAEAAADVLRRLGDPRPPPPR